VDDCAYSTSRNASLPRPASPPYETTTEAQQLVDDALADLKAAQVKASGETRAGLSGEQVKAIVDEASRFDADLIIMGSRGRSDFQALLLGSIAHKVVRYAHCPVLIVRLPCSVLAPDRSARLPEFRTRRGRPPGSGTTSAIAKLTAKAGLSCDAHSSER
jgi:hypothetical protein